MQHHHQPDLDTREESSRFYYKYIGASNIKTTNRGYWTSKWNIPDYIERRSRLQSSFAVYDK